MFFIAWLSLGRRESALAVFLRLVFVQQVDHGLLDAVAGRPMAGIALGTDIITPGSHDAAGVINAPFITRQGGWQSHIVWIERVSQV